MSLITYVTRIHFADRVIEDALPEEARAHGLRRPMLIADASGEADDALERVREALPRDCRPILLSAAAPLPEADACAAARRFAEAGCDGAVGVGGPSAIDLARLLGAAAEGRGPVPVFAAPTTTATVGLGPLVGAVGGLRATAPRTPAVVFCDPTLTLAEGPEATAAAGMDALTHCLEAWLGAGYNPPADGIALEGLRRAGAWLERAVADGDDLEARREMLAAALNAGLAAQKGFGGVHAVAGALEAEIGLSARHGMLHAALLPHMLEFNAPAAGERFAGLREALRLRPRDALPEAMAALGARLALPTRLGAFGLDRAALRRVAAAAAADPATRTNPRHATADDYLGLLEAAT